MKRYNTPEPSMWDALCTRPTLSAADLTQAVSDILNNVRQRGDAALFDYTRRFDRCALNDVRVTPEEIARASASLDPELKAAIRLAGGNIERFHNAQLGEELTVEIMPGVVCRRVCRPIERVGFYIPGGTAPLFSTILMLAIPAAIAGCKERILVTPPNANGEVHPAILYAANTFGITEMFKVGGAQAIAALAYGTESIPKVAKIFGPGNQYVTKAKELVQLDGVAIDLPAGPSEVLVIADETAVPEFVAADLLSQAEHGVDSQVVLLTTSEAVIDAVERCLDEQLAALPRQEVAAAALENSFAVVCRDVNECAALSNRYAPEHLIIAAADPESVLERITNAGSVFLGNYSCESAGDYASGTNHVLPTNGCARNYSGVSLDSFVKKITVQNLSAEGLMNIGPAIERMAAAEDMEAHKNAVSIRLKSLRS